ncbi:right-handed parallel beta-helix repeat-containing protein [Synechocystis salina LEGE 06155]|uniref:Right handed beta helix domain-containing protein n=1 Tax=Synechocystis salina LEGE 06155 TaxID=945782 RepID=A0A0K1SAZ3_9SYNC|nr:hypothetical protein [Synechocystis salina LEGE 06155]MBE9175728.1 right-handed parallel beta-helix repeat-containing protein [Synechocystis salina LEGE 06155]
MATFFVNNLNDSGAGSLREALTTANSTPGTDSIVFNVSGQINLIDPLVITDDVRINWPAIVFRTPAGIPFFTSPTSTITIDGTGLDDDGVGSSDEEDIFQISNGATVEMNNLVLNNAGEDAIAIDSGDLKLFRVNIFNSDDDGIDSVSNGGLLQIVRSEIAQNGDDGIDVAASGATIVLEGAKVYDNDDYGIDIEGNDLTITINKSDVYNNDDSGLRLNDIETDNSFTTLKITNSSFEGNSDGIELESDGLTGFLSAVRANGNDDEGVQIEGDDGIFTIIKSQFSNNGSDGLILVEDDGGDSADNNKLTIIDSLFNDNFNDGLDIDGDFNQVSVFGGSSRGNGDSLLSEDGRGVEVSGTGNRVFLNRILIANNYSGGDGGGIGIFGVDNIVNLMSSVIKNNESLGDGGGIFIRGIVPESVPDETTGNQLIGRFNRIFDNFSGNNGGGISIGQSATASLFANFIRGNTDSNNGSSDLFLAPSANFVDLGANIIGTTISV